MKALVLILLFPVLFTIPLENAVLLEGVGTLNRIAGLIFSPVILLLLLSRMRIPGGVVLLIIFFLLLVVYMGFSVLWAPDMTRAYEAWFSAVQVLVMSVMLIMVGVSFGLRAICIPYILGALVSAIWILQVAGSLAATGRVLVEGFNPNWMAYLMVMAGVGIFAVIGRAFFLEKILYLLIWVVIGASVFFLGSRGGLIFYMMVTLAIFFRLPAIYAIASVIALSLALPAVALVVLNDFAVIIDRYMLGIELAFSGDFSGRGSIWQAGWRHLENPVFGAGPAGFRVVLDRAPHNAVLSVFFNLGAVGFLLFCAQWALLILLWYFSNVRFAAMALILASLLVPLMLANWEFHKGIWFAYSVIFTFLHINITEYFCSADSASRSVNIKNDAGDSPEALALPGVD